MCPQPTDDRFTQPQSNGPASLTADAQRELTAQLDGREIPVSHGNAIVGFDYVGRWIDLEVQVTWPHSSEHFDIRVGATVAGNPDAAFDLRNAGIELLPERKSDPLRPNPLNDGSISFVNLSAASRFQFIVIWGSDRRPDRHPSKPRVPQRNSDDVRVSQWSPGNSQDTSESESGELVGAGSGSYESWESLCFYPN